MDRTVTKAVLLALAAVCAMGLVVDVKNTAKYGQIDLRNRVVGARAMLEGKDPYSYVWAPGDPPRLRDPLAQPGSPSSKTTVTPAVLALHALVAGPGYRVQKWLWLAVQWACYAGTVLAALRLAPPLARPLVLGLGLAFACSAFWRLHVEVGQAPVLYGAMAAGGIALLRRPGPAREILGGGLLGLLVAFRPQFVFLGLPLLVYTRWCAVAGAVGGAALGAGLPMLLSPSVWAQYYGMLHRYLVPVAGHAVPGEAGAAPLGIEGLTNITSFYPCFPDVDSSLAGLLRELCHTHLPGPVYFALLLLAAGGWVLLLRRDQHAGAPLEFALARALGLVLLADLLLPIRRLLYSEVILVPIALLLVATGGRRVRESPWCLFLLALAALVSFEIKWAFLAELVPVAAILLLTLTVPWRSEEPA